MQKSEILPVNYKVELHDKDNDMTNNRLDQETSVMGREKKLKSQRES